ncbi:MAG: hypothetical protein AAF412_12080 [Pseudomonadota bacterium]
MTKHEHRQQDSGSSESEKILERVAQDSETVGTSSMRRVAERINSDAGLNGSDEDTWAEVWGTRIGRGLGLVFVAWLIFHLVQTYVLGG